VFSQIDLKVSASKRLFLILLIPSYLSIAVLIATLDVWTGVLLAAFVASNLQLSYACTYGKNSVRMLILRNDQLFINHKQADTLSELVSALWLSPKIGILCLRLSNEAKQRFYQPKRMVFICPMNTNNEAQLRRFRVHTMHNHFLQSRARN
jgi:hypothetical protein